MKHKIFLVEQNHTALLNKTRFLLAAVFTLVIVTACTQNKETDPKNNKNEPVKNKVKKEKPDFVIECSYDASRFGKKPKVNFADDDESFSMLYMVLHSNKSVKKTKPEINMDKYNVFMLYGGEKKETYHTMVIKDHEKDGKTMNLKIALEKSPPTSKAISRFSTPYCLIQFKKDIDTIVVDTDIKYFEKEINVNEMERYGTKTNKNSKNELDYKEEKKKRRTF